ncbi:hypothetical protein TNCV_4512141 [Trichonephila clavipes]|nr:hypothetical protein TNCV_4512141 [Trichonephila clavipes]
MSDRGTQNSSSERARCMPLVIRSFQHHAGDSTLRLSSSTILREKVSRMVRGLPSIFSFHQPHERTNALTAIWSTQMSQRDISFTNIHTFSGIRTQALRHSSQRR